MDNDKNTKRIAIILKNMYNKLHNKIKHHYYHHYYKSIILIENLLELTNLNPNKEECFNGQE